MRNPRDFAHPLAIGAPEPMLEIPLKPSRMIHFLDFSNEKMVAKAPDIAKQTDILLGNLEDAIPVDRKEAAREGLVKAAKEADLGDTALWTRVNSLESPWVLDDLTRLVGEIGDKLEVIMVPKVEGAWDIHYVDRLLAQLEAKAKLDRPILVHAILETSLGVVNLEEIATASPRMQGMSFGPADLAASRRMKTTRVGGGHPGYRVIDDPDPDDPEAPRASAQQDPWHYSIARMVDACTSAGHPALLRPLRRHQGHRRAARPSSAPPSCSAASAPGRFTRPRSRSRRRSSARRPRRSCSRRRCSRRSPTARGVHMIDGKMQDDATWKQCKVMVDAGRDAAPKDPELDEAYEMYGGHLGLPARRGVGLLIAFRHPPAGPLPRVRSAGDRLQRPLPRLRRHRPSPSSTARPSAPGRQAMAEHGVDIVVAEVNVRYLAPLRFDDEFDLALAELADRQHLDDDRGGDENA